MKLYDSELKIMELLWDRGELSAKELSLIGGELYDWNKNTTYTIIKKLVDKQAVKRTEPGFMCTAIVEKEDVQNKELNSIIEKFWAGSKKAFFSAFAEQTNFSSEEVEKLLAKIEEDDHDD